jgi:hypothetical protein
MHVGVALLSIISRWLQDSCFIRNGLQNKKGVLFSGPPLGLR